MARFAFFGTPDFAVPSLQAVHDCCKEGGHELLVVVTQPDKRRGRGKQTMPSPVKRAAQELGLAVAQPATLKKGSEEGDEFAAHLADLDLDLAVVTAYGKIIPKRILRMPRRGFLNVHGSLLPRWRGAAPIQRAIEAGDRETGVCLMDMIYKLDAGDVYAAASTPILEADDSTILAERLADLGGDLLRSHLDAIVEGTLQKTPQPGEGVTYAHMLEKNEADVRWDLSARQVACKARAMQPWPGTKTVIDDVEIKLFGPTIVDDVTRDEKPGCILSVDERGLVVQCGLGVVAFAEVQAAGKRRMTAVEFAAGRRSIVRGICTYRDPSEKG